MALSLMQEAQITGLLAGRGLKQELGMKQDSLDLKQSTSPPLNNNSSSNNNNNLDEDGSSSSSSAAAAVAAANLFTNIGLFNSNLYAQMMMAGLSPFRQLPYGGWAPASSPPLAALPGPLSPALGPKGQRRHNNNNNNSSSNNNNVVTSSSGGGGGPGSDRLAKPGSSSIVKKRPIKSVSKGQQPSVEGAASPPSPTDTATRDKLFTCAVCNRSFGYKHVLQNHERTHTGEKPFQCPVCHKKFTRDHHLKTHMRLHTGEKPYHCVHCDRQFVQVANLRRHLRVHTGERPYACESCPQKFSDSNQLKAHQLIHKNEKPFRCDSCGLNFRRRHHLASHKCLALAAAPSHQPQQPQPTAQPLNLAELVALPVQTEPEDLSMPAATRRAQSHAGSSPASHSGNDTDEIDDELARCHR